MAARNSSKIIVALEKKGFRGKKGRQKDLRFVLYVDGKKTSVRTKVSHGIDTYGESLLGKMKTQLRLNNLAELLALIDCPLTGPAYVQLLRDSGIL